LKANPNDRVALTWTREAYAALGKTGEALKAFDAAVEASRESVDAWRGKGLLHLKLEQFPAAADALGHATEIRSIDKGICYTRGIAEDRAGCFEDAVVG